MKVAVVQDWLTEIGGAEKVFSGILELFPEADIYTLAAHERVLTDLKIDRNRVYESFIVKLPFGRKKYRNYLPLFSKAIESFDLSDYDLILSSSSSVAKGILKQSNQLHICYCHSPVRYAWDLYHQYLKEASLQGFGPKALFVRHVLHKLRIWDVISANRVDHFIANSKYIKRRINNVYRKDSTVIYPPVDIEKFRLEEEKSDYYFTASRMVPYKKIDLIVKTFSELPDKKLKVAGVGPDFEKIKKLAGSNVEFLGFVSDEEMQILISQAKAFVFAANEDFGIIPVEAQACGTPVIALGKGGTKETVIDGITGVHFESQTEEALKEAIHKFEAIKFDFQKIRESVEKFSKTRFINELKQFISVKLHDFHEEIK
ncbi:glycosyltransferase involved in cell wall biosynthesis [Marinilabilia salmonicolor]|jgi:glycosyltransferase involved in cell wall biosynthesis|uniref:glycosyltransferase n=1 Tax=Marinilabilia salmonicolor TaxID=989 RepID=UPI000D049A43|nr:glycosyltransferase [Marinilabilia salmonicolor]PRY94375.1 glycosyltransferase involved in cell wall biosynthesis [Marinilabilia salmonicolor]